MGYLVTITPPNEFRWNLYDGPLYFDLRRITFVIKHPFILLSNMSLCNPVSVFNGRQS